MKILMWLSIGLDRRTPSEHLLTAIVKALYERGHTVHILQKSTGGDKPNLPEQMLRYGVTTTYISKNPVGKQNFIARYLSDISYVFKCNKLLESLKFDCVFMQSSNVAGFQTGMLKKRHKNVPITFNVQDIFPENAVYSKMIKKKSLLYRLLSAIQKKAYKDATRIITISEDMRDQLIELGVDSGKISVIYNWSYQNEVYDSAQETSEVVNLLMREGSFKAVYAGNIGMMQNIGVVIEAAARLRENAEIKFYIFGSGLYRKKLESQAQKLGLDNVFFYDILPAELAPALYCKANVNIIPLAENIYRTALPSKTATCLACQKPIILAIGKQSKFASRVEEETGAYVVESNDGEALSKAILDIYAGKIKYDSKDFFISEFQSSINSAKYACIITETEKE